jgi:Fuc2NAc and GlcNAc transferase
MIDHPNARSSHLAPTPRGGGIAIVVASVLCVSALLLAHVIDRDLALAIVVGGIAIAWVGFMDDRNSMSVRLRIAIHFAAAALAVGILGGVPSLQVGTYFVSGGAVSYVVGVLAIVWTLNLFNFMDGIDGIAGSEAVFVSISGAWLGIRGLELTPSSSVALVIGAASLGFLFWNWPPAKIFMGDVGSGFLGYAIAVIALAAAKENPVAAFTWLILGGLFFVDATVTLARRLFRGERAYQAHRCHAYQWLSRRWKSHQRVTLTVWGINLVWLLPMAWLSQRYAQQAVMIVALALAPLVIAALVAGAGKAEEQ